MEWRVDDARALERIHPTVSETDMMNYNTWVNNIRYRNMTPLAAASDFDSYPKKMKGKYKGQYILRIGGSNRVSYTFENGIVKVQQIGGHT